jgi:hypothetical protein
VIAGFKLQIQDSFVKFLKLMPFTIIFKCFELSCYKKVEEMLHLYLKEINLLDLIHKNLIMKALIEVIIKYFWQATAQKNEAIDEAIL